MSADIKASQLEFFKEDISKMIDGKKARIISMLFMRAFWGILIYRLERGLFKYFGERYSIIRMPFAPLFNMIQQFSNIEIPYRANIHGGMQIFHPSLGIVISQFSEIGENVVLYGGNVIGTKNLHSPGVIKLGNNCVIGANAVILGPLVIADSCKVGAMSCVLKSCLIEGATLVGVPAKIIR